MLTPYERILKRAGIKKILSKEKIERRDQLLTQIIDLRKKADYVNKKVYDQKEWMKKNTASPEQQKKHNDNLELQKDYTRQIKNLELLLSEIEN